jgi:hypothetical protein
MVSALALFLSASCSVSITDHNDYRDESKFFSDSTWTGVFPGPLNWNGGAFSIIHADQLRLVRCQFQSCGAGIAARVISTSGGAVYVANVTETTVIDTIVDSCFVDGGGGAFFFATPAVLANFTNSIFRNCTARNGTSGGGLSLPAGGTLVVLNCTFSGCASTRVGGGIHFSGAGNVSVARSCFAANTAPIAGGIYVAGADTLAIQSTAFLSNNASAIVLANVTGGRLELVSVLLNTTDVIASAIVLAGTTGGLWFDLCCFNTTDRTVDGTGLHINSTVVGTIGFGHSLCFDLPQKVAVYFAEGQPAPGPESFNCTFCAPVFPASVTQSPKETRTPSPQPVPTRSPWPPDVPTAETSKWSVGEIVGWSVGGVGLLALLVVAILMYLFVYKPGQERNRDYAFQGLSGAPLGSTA